MRGSESYRSLEYDTRQWKASDETGSSGSPVSDFTLPTELEATGPIEVLGGTSRDDLRLLVASKSEGIIHSRFHKLYEHLRPGDVVVANDSRTLPAALGGLLRGREIRLHMSTKDPDTGLQLVEVRSPNGLGSIPYSEDLRPGEVIRLHAGGSAQLIEPHAKNRPYRLWKAAFDLPGLTLSQYLRLWGQPIRYSYIAKPWPLKYYQTIFATHPGSSEMPSAGRPFSRALVRRMLAKGVRICCITLHTGVASQESHEPPYAEPYWVSPATAETINTARQGGGRVIAVGTTVVRTLETVCGSDGSVEPSHGWTSLVVSPERRLRAVDGIITGLHEPRATHLMMLEAIAGKELLAASYSAALRHGYRWHEFGDSHLIIP